MVVRGLPGHTTHGSKDHECTRQREDRQGATRGYTLHRRIEQGFYAGPRSRHIAKMRNWQARGKGTRGGRTETATKYTFGIECGGMNNLDAENSETGSRSQEARQ